MFGLKLLVLFLCSTTAYGSALDLLVMVDLSDSSLSEFQKTQELLETFGPLLALGLGSIGPCDIQAALITMGDKTIVNWNLQSPETSTASKLISAVANVNLNGGNIINFRDPVNKAIKKVWNSGLDRPTVPNLTVIVTGSKTGENKTKLKRKAKKLCRKSKVLVIPFEGEATSTSNRELKLLNCGEEVSNIGASGFSLEVFTTIGRIMTDEAISGSVCPI